MSNQVSVAEAARLVGKTPRTIYRAIDKGCLSASQDVAGARVIDIAELVRVYGELRRTCHSDTQRQMPRGVTDDTAELKAQIATLRAENGQLKERLADGKEHINDLRQQVLMLRDMRPEQEAGTPWWKRLFGYRLP